MEPIFASLQANALLFGLMMIRVGALFATAPILSSRVVPARVRAVLVLALVLSMLPLMAENSAPIPSAAGTYLVLALKEMVVGATIGLIAQMIFAAVQMAGSFIDIGAGFAMATTMDPATNVNITILGRAYNMIVTAAFVAIGGHLLLLQGVLASFTLVPPAAVPRMEVLIQGVMVGSAQMFVIAMQLAAPLMAALLITDVALGIMARAAPQMNVFIVGLPVKMTVAIAGTMFLLPAFVAHFNRASNGMIETLSAVLLGAAP